MKLLVVAAAVLACAQAAPPTPSAAPSTTPGPSSAPTATASRASAHGASDRGPASPSRAGHGPGRPVDASPAGCTICASFLRLRPAEFDAQGHSRFGVERASSTSSRWRGSCSLEADIQETPFEDLIDAVVNGQCDISVSGQFVTQERLGRIDMIAYREGSVSPVLPAGNPLNIDVITDLCGRRVSIVEGTIYVDIMRGLGEYAASGIKQQCEQAGQGRSSWSSIPARRRRSRRSRPARSMHSIGNEAVCVRPSRVRAFGRRSAPDCATASATDSARPRWTTRCARRCER